MDDATFIAQEFEGTVSDVSQADKLLFLLRDGEWKATPEILEKVYGGDHLGIARIAARIGDLKKRGHLIQSRKQEGSETVWQYRLLERVPVANSAEENVSRETGASTISTNEVLTQNLSENLTTSPNSAINVTPDSIITVPSNSPSGTLSMPKTEQPKLTELKKRTKAIRDALAEVKGLPIPEEAIKLLSRAAVAYSDACELSGSQKAQRDELGAIYAAKEGSGKAELLAKGSEFGMCHTESEAIANGVLEIVNTLKKVSEYWNQSYKQGGI